MPARAAAKPPERPYVTASRLKQLVAIARAAGLDVDGAGVEFYPDGRVRLMPARTVAAEPSLFEQWEAHL